MNKRVMLSALLVLLLSTVVLQGQTNNLPIPTNLTAQLVPTVINTVKLTWQAPHGPWEFRVFRSTGSTAAFQPIGVTPGREFFDHSVTQGQTYRYYVTTIQNNAGVTTSSPPSNIVQITIGNVVIPVRGTIAGTVVDDSTGTPIKGIGVRFYRNNSPSMWAPQIKTDSLGRYAAVLDTGRYLVRAEPPFGSPWVPEWFENAATPSTATTVVVAETSVTVINFGLARVIPPSYAYISGTVTDTLGNPMRNATVAILRTLQEMASLSAITGATVGGGNEIVHIDGLGLTHGVVWRGFTDSLGKYNARVIDGKSYIALASKYLSLPQFYDRKTNPTDADIIVVNGNVTGINFFLAPNPIFQNSISGTVKDSLGTPVRSRVVLMPLQPALTSALACRVGHTDSLGQYQIDNVRLGKYFVRAIPFSGYAPAFYKAGAFGVIHRANADTVLISGNVTNINIGVVPVSNLGIIRIVGKVRASNGQPLVGADLFVKNAQGLVLGYAFTDATGSYELNALPSGQVFVSAELAGYNLYQGTMNLASSVFSVSNVNFTLSPGGLTSNDPNSSLIPGAYDLEQNYPNPFNPATSIRYTLPNSSEVSIEVFNAIGQHVATLFNGKQEAGTHEVRFNGEDLASGVYMYRLTAGNFVSTKKLMLLK